MPEQSPESTLPSLDDLRMRIDQWRNTREKVTRMPSDLWSAAATLAKAEGLYPVSRALKLNYESLKRRVGSTDSLKKCKASTPSFVEYSFSDQRLPPNECEIQIKGSVVLRFAVRDVSELAPLIDSLRV